MPAPQRLLSVRNRIYILNPLPPQKRWLSVNGYQLAMGLLGLGMAGVVGYGAIVLASLFNSPVDTLAEPDVGSPRAQLPAITTPTASPNVDTPEARTTGGGLLRPTTNPNQRSNAVSVGRKNPFMAVRSLSVLLPGQVTWLSTPKPTPKVANLPSPVLPNPVESIPPLSIEQPPAPNLAPPPFPVAQPGSTPGLTATTSGCDVQINGVIQTNGQPMVVLKIKSEEKAYSRPVSVGERVCNGTVGVRNIIGLGGAQPMVILEQNGQEIMKQIDTNIVQEQDPQNPSLESFN